MELVGKCLNYDGVETNLSDHCSYHDSRVDLDTICDVTKSKHGDDLSYDDLVHCCFASIPVLLVLFLVMCLPYDLLLNQIFN